MLQGHILIVDECFESDQTIGFLLRLAGFKTTLARTSREGINWLTSLHEESSGFDLMLIRNVVQITDLSILCDVVNRLTNGLNVLYVEQHHSTEVIDAICSRSCGRICLCRSDETMQHIRLYFDQKAKK